MSDSLQSMRVQKGDPVLASHWNSLIDWMKQLQIIGGTNVRVSRTPYGTTVDALPAAVAQVGAFAVSLGSGPNGQTAAVSLGLIEGIKPTIAGYFIDGTDTSDKKPPVLQIPIAVKEEAYIHLKCTISKESWRIEKAEITFEREVPVPKEWTAYKLLAILRKSGEAPAASWQVAHQAVHFNLGHYAYGRKSSGKARHLWFAR